ncbi:hypothetical protein RB599_010293 [Gaeumannomyces hyphopodioides]
MWLLALLLCFTVGAVAAGDDEEYFQTACVAISHQLAAECQAVEQKLDPTLRSLVKALNDLQETSCFADKVCTAANLLKSLDLSKNYTPPDLRIQEVTLQTTLTDPAYVNLGPNVPANIVSRPDRESGRKNVTLTSGLGRSVSVQLIDKEYVSGSIQVARSFLTLPKPFDQTLMETGGKRFYDALKNASLLDGASTTPGITAFVPTDAAFNGVSVDASVLRQHLLYGVLAYTPELKVAARFRTENGSALVVSAQNAAYSVNGARIVTPNVITKNGVIHYVDKFFTFGDLAAASAGTGNNQAGNKKSGAAGHDGLFGLMPGPLVGAILAVFAA